MRIALRICWLGWLFPVAVLLTSCGSLGNNFGQTPVRLGTFAWAYSLAGQVARSPALLAIVTNKHGTVLAYACDGQRVAEWFVGVAQQQSADVTSPDGSRLQVTFTDRNAQGTLTLTNGVPLTFQINLAAKPAGLYSTKQEVKGVVYLAGWVVLADGRQAGMLQTATGQTSAPRLDPAHPQISLPDGGVLTPQLVTPESDL